MSLRKGCPVGKDPSNAVSGSIPRLQFRAGGLGFRAMLLSLRWLGVFVDKAGSSNHWSQVWIPIQLARLERFPLASPVQGLELGNQLRALCIGSQNDMFIWSFHNWSGQYIDPNIPKSQNHDPPKRALVFGKPQIHMPRP